MMDNFKSGSFEQAEIFAVTEHGSRQILQLLSFLIPMTLFLTASLSNRNSIKGRLIVNGTVY